MTQKHPLLEIICTWFYSGRVPFAPGTFGSLATLPFAYFIMKFFGIWGLGSFVIVICFLGIWASDRYAKALEIKDPGFIVIDEVAGQAISLLAAGLNLYLYAAAFVLFRLFDISKPWIIGWADRKVKGGLGIMLDDILAGIAAGILVWGMSFII